MKQVLLLGFILFLGINTNAQSRYTTTKYNKADVGAIVAEYPFEERTVKDGLKQHFEKMGYKAKSAKAGFEVYTGVNVSEISDLSLDIYILVDRKSKQEKDKSVVTFMLSKGFEAFISDETDNKIINNAKDYFNKLKENLVAYDLELQIAEQENTISKADKKYAGIMEDSVKLAKRKADIELQISENTNAQAAQKMELEKQKQILENLKKKRKGGAKATTQAASPANKD